MIDYQAARIAMVDGQIRPSDVTLYPILEAMLSVPREIYVPTEKRSVAYVGEHIALDNGRVVLAPRVLAKMLEAVAIQPDDLVLCVGAGLGYSTAVMARMAEAVIAVEEDTALASAAETNLSEQSADNAVVHTGALIEGAAAHGPYDVIVIDGGVEAVPNGLLDQLKLGGRIALLSMDGPSGQCRVGIRSDNGINWRTSFDATAPLLPGFSKEQSFAF